MTVKNRQPDRAALARAERLKQALRANLKRRKAQQRGQAGEGAAAGTHDSAGFVPDKPKG